jgi:hypothetical protein
VGLGVVLLGKTAQRHYAVNKQAREQQIATERATAPHGVLEISVQNPQEIRLDGTVLLQAKFQDGKGIPQSTDQKIAWDAKMQAASARDAQKAPPALRNVLYSSVTRSYGTQYGEVVSDGMMQVQLPTQPVIVTVRVAYQDVYGRNYVASSILDTIPVPVATPTPTPTPIPLATPKATPLPPAATPVPH